MKPRCALDRANRNVTHNKIASAAAIGSSADGRGEDRTRAQLPATMMIAPKTGTTQAVVLKTEMSDVAVAMVARAAYALNRSCALMRHRVDRATTRC